MLDLVECKFHRVAVALAHRGDLGYAAPNPDLLSAPLILDGEVAVGMGLTGLVIVPRSEIAMAFAV